MTLQNGTRVQLGEMTDVTDLVTTAAAAPALASVEFDYHQVDCSEEEFQCDNSDCIQARSYFSIITSNGVLYESNPCN